MITGQEQLSIMELAETLQDGTEIWVTADPEQDVTPAREARELDDGQGWGKRFYDAVRYNLRRYGVWGWCRLTITAQGQDGREGNAYLGCCSYRGLADFKRGGYYEQKRAEALRELANQ